MNIYVKYCKKCKKPFDIGTNYDLCYECRTKQEVKNGRNKKRNIC